jgi:hypothetical protein
MGTGDFTMTFPSPPGSMTAATGDATFGMTTPSFDFIEVTVVSGTVSIHGSSSSGYTAEYSFTLRTASGEMIAISGAHTKVAACRAEQMCSF